MPEARELERLVDMHWSIRHCLVLEHRREAPTVHATHQHHLEEVGPITRENEDEGGEGGRESKGDVHAAALAAGCSAGVVDAAAAVVAAARSSGRGELVSRVCGSKHMAHST